MKKMLYFLDGYISHRRIGKISHFFKNQHIFCLINLMSFDQKKKSFDKQKPWYFSINKFNLTSIYFKDHGKRNSEKVKNLISFIFKISKINLCDEIYLLCFPRVLGFGFNPISVYFMFKDKKLIKIIYEVKNTFGDIHHYVGSDNKRINKFEKKMFVSPFYKNNGYYNLSSIFEKKYIFVKVNYYFKNRLIFNANLKANFILEAKNKIFKVFLNTITFPSKVWINIHYEALKLFLKKIKIQKIPNEQINKQSYSKLIKK